MSAGSPNVDVIAETPGSAARSGVCSHGKGAGRYSRSRDTGVESRYSSSSSLPALRVLILTCLGLPVERLALGLEHECAVNLAAVHVSASSVLQATRVIDISKRHVILLCHPFVQGGKMHFVREA